VLLVTGLSSDRAHGDEEILLIENTEPNATESVTFAVKNQTDVHITAVGAERSTGETMYAYPWIINAESRNMVWSMDDEFTRPFEDSESLRQYDDDLSLTPGSYTLYYHTGHPYFLSGTIDLGDLKIRLQDLDKDIEKLMKKFGVSGDEANKKREGGVAAMAEIAKKLYVRVSGNPSDIAVIDHAGRPEALLALDHPGNDAYLSEGFTLSRDLELQICAIGEYYSSDEVMVDWGWIIDADTRDHVWEMHKDNTGWAGGADKNRRFRDRQEFTAGNYVAYFVTDDSHTSDDWNSNPPYDPDGWGLRVYAVNPADRAYVKPFADDREEKPIVRLTRVGDNERVSEAFRVETPAKVRVYAIGEYDRFRDRMADYAWIVRADGDRKVWIMTAPVTEPAGGDSKNRRFDGVVALDSGDYVLYYSSDGSHSFAGGWKASPPYDQQSYGVSIFPADQGRGSSIVIIDKDDVRHRHALAEITDLGNNEDRQVRFSLSSPTRVNIEAVGEGTRYEMADYGWIENETTGDIVWEMTYRKTSHAGGAEKNRLVNQTILLDKGDYAVHFVTDDSHTADDPNDEPPDAQYSWGIVLTKAERSGN
jgi:hypothetical protein